MSVNIYQRMGLHDEYNRPTVLDEKLSRFGMDTVLPIIIYYCLCVNFVLENAENWHFNFIKSVESQVLGVQDIAKNGVNAVPTNFVGCTDEQIVALTADFTEFYRNFGSYMIAFDTCSTYFKIDDTAFGNVHVLDVPSLAAERRLDRLFCLKIDNGRTIASHNRQTRFIGFHPVYFQMDRCGHKSVIAHEFTHALGFFGDPDHNDISVHKESNPSDHFRSDMPYCVTEFVKMDCVYN